MLARANLIFQRVAKGCHGHPGTGVLLLFIAMGALAGAERGSWQMALAGAAVMAGVFGPMYIYGAWDRGQ